MKLFYLLDIMKVSSSIYLKFSRIKKISLQQNIVVNYSFLLKFNCNKFAIGNICPKLKYKVPIVSLDFFLVSFFFIEYFMNNCTWSIFHLNMLRIIFTRRHMEFRLFNRPWKWSLLSCIFTSVLVQTSFRLTIVWSVTLNYGFRWR